MTVSAGQIFGTCPADGRPLPPVPTTPVEAVADAVRRSRDAQERWAGSDMATRAARLSEVRERFLADADRIVALLYDEVGKPAAEAWTSEIVADARLFSFWINNAARMLAPQRVRLNPIDYQGKRGVIESVPRGVIGLITPWNLPVAIPLRTLVPALMAGNAVVWKPSELTPRVGAALHEHFAGVLPAGLVELVQGDGAIGAALVRSGVSMVVFTGSDATGRKVAVAAAEQLIPVSLELGGKDAAIVLADADVERTAHGLVWAAFYNSGQNCAAVERVYVEQAIAGRLVERVSAIAGALGRGQVGPLISARQRDIVRRHVDAAVAAGAHAVVGGPELTARTDERANAWYYPPTVLTGVADDMAVMRDETFGPVLPIAVVRDADEAVRRANDSRYGLTASIWTRDLRRGEAIARRLRTGVVTVNNHAFTAAIPAAPWAGTQASGYGVTNSEWAIKEMVRPRFVLVDRSRSARELWWYPYNRRLVTIGRAMTTLLRKGGGKPGALRALMVAFARRFKDDE